MHYIDMDGVIVDLQGNLSATDLMQCIPHMGVEDWATLPKTVALDYWRNRLSGQDVYVLSRWSTPSSCMGKVLWLQEHAPDWRDRLILVPSDKSILCSGSQDILYDDYDHNIRMWVQAGGIGMLCHTGTGYPV